MSELAWAQDQLRHIAPTGSVKERIRNAARVLQWTHSRTKAVWYADDRVSLRAHEVLNMAGKSEPNSTGSSRGRTLSPTARMRILLARRLMRCARSLALWLAPELAEDAANEPRDRHHR